MIMVFLLICGSNENDITERLKAIIQANAVVRQQESSGSFRYLVWMGILSYQIFLVKLKLMLDILMICLLI